MNPLHYGNTKLFQYIQAIAALSEARMAFAGGVLVILHDQYFIGCLILLIHKPPEAL